MTDQKPTGVFVRLPLSEEQIVSIAGWIPGSREELRNEVLPSIFSIIGTPVTGGELYPIGYIHEDAIGGLATGVYQSASIFRDEDEEHNDSIPLVRQSEAQAQIAARDAEIVRLREIPALFSEYEKLMDSGEDVAGMMVYAELKKRVHKSLKGGAA